MAKDRSCKGVKNTKMTKDCVTYCAGRNKASYVRLL